MATSIVQRMRTELDGYTRGMRSIAETILRRPERVLCMSLVELADLAEVSEPTILRFCRQLGCTGYKDFKRRLSEELAVDGISRRFDVTDEGEEGSLRSMVSWRREEFDSHVAAIEEEAFSRATDILAHAKDIVFWASGSSSCLAIDAQETFEQAGIACSMALGDDESPFDETMLAEDAAVVALSREGTDPRLLSAMARATRRGIPVVGVTVDNSPMVRSSTVAITLRRSNLQDFRSVMCLWMAMYFVIDALTVATSIARSQE